MIPGNFDISKQVCDSERALCYEGHDGEDNYRRDVRMRACSGVMCACVSASVWTAASSFQLLCPLLWHNEIHGNLILPEICLYFR
jgi:hypothetical protein